MNPSGTGATFREWSNLISLVTTLVIYPVMLYRWAAHPDTIIALAWQLFVGVVIQVVVIIVTQIALAIFTKNEPDDERVRAIEHGPARVRGALLTIGIFAAIGLTILQELRGVVLDGDSDFFSNPTLDSPILVGYMLFGVFYFAEVVRMALVAVGYRRH